MDADSAAAQMQRKIELQSPEDLSFLISNVRSAAAERLNEAFPLGPGHGEDELRRQIERIVNDYINETFSLAAPNLSINGLPLTSPDTFLYSTSSTTTPTTASEQYEPFDAHKRRRVADLITQEEKLLEEVAALKRAVPSRAAAEYAERWKDELGADQKAVEERGAARDGEDDTGLQMAMLERQEGVEAGWKGAVDGLGRLKRDMPSIVAKMERARVAGEYVVTDGR